MRTVAVLLALFSMVPAAVAIKPAHPGPSVAARLRSLNEHLASPPDFSNLRCSNRVFLSLSADRREIIATYRLIDKHGNVRAKLPPQYVYRIPVASVKTAYIYGRWTRNDRVLIRTYRKDVVKIGPLWDCWRNRPKALPRERILDNADLQVHGATNEQLYRIVDEFKQLVKILQSEPPRNATPAAQPDADGQ